MLTMLLGLLLIEVLSLRYTTLGAVLDHMLYTTYPVFLDKAINDDARNCSA